MARNVWFERSEAAIRHAASAGIAAALMWLGASSLRADEPWISTVGRDHPLVGTIVRTADGTTVERTDLFVALARASYVLLGEKHDNADHHRLQAAAIAALVAAGRRPTVAFEMLTADQAERIARHRRDAPADIAGIAPAAQWSESGWPAWPLYEPVFAAAVRAGLPIVAGGLETSEVRAVARGGIPAIERAPARALVQSYPLSAASEDRLRATIAASHCGHAPAAALGGMIAAQRARDAALALALVEAATDSAVLIAGTGHVRADFGVPVLIAHAAATRPAVTVAFVEVRAGRRSIGDYADAFGVTPPPFDFLWFTPAVDDIDPCEKFRRALDRMRPRE